MSVGSYEVSPRPPALAHRMAQWSGARPNWRAAGGSNRGSGIRFFRTASPHTPYISAFLGRPPRPQAPNLSIFWTGLPAGTPKIYPHRWTAFVRIFRGPDCICNGGFRPFSRFASGHLPYSVDLHRPALCLPLRISLRNLVYEVISTSDGCLIFLEGTRRRRGCAEAGGWSRGNIVLAELRTHSNLRSCPGIFSW